MDEALLPLVAIVFLGGLVQGVAGFGFGLVTMAIAPLYLELTEAVPLLAVLGLVVSLTVLVGWRREASFRLAAPMLAGGVVGIPIGVWVLATVPSRGLLGVLGAVVAAYGVAHLVRERRGEREAVGEPCSPRWGVAAGLVGGLFGGAFNTGGPPVVAYVAARRMDQGLAKATLQLFFVLGLILQLSLFGVTGRLTAGLLELDLLLAPILIGATWIGTRLSRHLPEAVFRRVLLGGLALLGANLCVRAIL